MAKTLVIVESPTKARTLERFLGDKYQVKASYGHVRDLPESASQVPDEIRKKKWGRLGVDTDGDFKPYYVVPDDKRKHVQELKAALKGASEVMLATDPDREGESISWHLLQVLKPKVPVKRIVFHEITKKAIDQAVKDAHDVDDNLVRAQESRRILDRLYGYTLSPVLWKKVQTGLSAGRVQSVAVRLIVDREEERLAFRTARYSDLDAQFSADGRTFGGTLTRLGDVRVASGKDFDANGVLTGKNVRLLSDADAATLVDTLNRHLPWTVTSVEAKPGVERPAAPFTTSTLTQEASRKLGFSTQRTMQAAQRLFQDGHISYHRTDSTTLSDEALAESARRSASCSATTTTPAPRRYATKVKNAQEAHEAIRPTNFTSAAASLEGVLSGDDLRALRADLEAHDGVADGGRARPAHDGRDLGDRGHGRAGGVHGVRQGDRVRRLPPRVRRRQRRSVRGARRAGDGAADADRRRARRRADGTRVRLAGLEPKGHETSPPARYTEASLIKELERIGVGRPSTFAATIGTIERRGYVFRQGKALVPSFTAFAVTRLLREHFGDLIDVEFTAEMEEDLDQISRGEREWLDFIRQFYRGDTHHRGLEEAVKQAEERADYPLIDVGVDPESGAMIRVRIGRYGPFLQLGEGGPGKTAGLPPTLAPADLTVEKAMALIRAKAEGPRTLGVDPKTGMNVYAINGRFGAYVQLGETPEKGMKEKPKRSSLTGSMTESTVTLDEALKLLELPRELGAHPESGEVDRRRPRPVRSVRQARRRLSIARGDRRSLHRRSRARARAAGGAEAVRASGGEARHPADRGDRRRRGAAGARRPIRSLRHRRRTERVDSRGADPATLSLEDARALIEARRGAPPRPGRGRRSGARRRRRGARPKGAPRSRGDAPPPAPSAKSEESAPQSQAEDRGKRAVRKRAS